jgi:hypothetical protein
VAGQSVIGRGGTGPATDRALARDPGRVRNLADPVGDLGLPASVSTVLDPTARDPRDRLALGTTDPGAKGLHHLRSGATASPGQRVAGRSSDARRGRGPTGRQVGSGRTGHPATIAPGRTGHPETIAPGRTGHPATIAPGRTGRVTTARGETVRPVRVRPLTGDRVATLDAAPFARSGRPRCRHPRSSGLTRS